MTPSTIPQVGRHPYLLAATGLLLLRTLLAPAAPLLPGTEAIPAAAVVITIAIAAPSWSSSGRSGRDASGAVGS